MSTFMTRMDYFLHSNSSSPTLQWLSEKNVKGQLS